MIVDILSIILTGLSVLLYLVLVFVRYRIKHEYAIDTSSITYLPDDFQRSERIGNQKQDLYSPSGDTSLVIEQYVIRHLRRNKVLMCKYQMPLQNIVFHVFLFDEDKNLIDNYLIKQSGSFRHSQVIVLPNDCAYVNLKMENYKDMTGSFRTMIHQSQITAIRLESYILFLMLFPVIYASFLIRDKKDEFALFVQEINGLILIILMALCSLIYYQVKALNVRHKLYTAGGKI